MGLAYAHHFAEQFMEAASAASRAAAANSRFSVPHYLHTAALVRLSRTDEAKAVAKIVLELQPSFTVAGLVAGEMIASERRAPLAQTLREAGLPD